MGRILPDNVCVKCGSQMCELYRQGSEGAGATEVYFCPNDLCTNFRLLQLSEKSARYHKFLSGHG